MSEKTYLQALNEALKQEMERDENVLIFGEDVGQFGGCFGVTQGLFDQFGEERVRDTPISESCVGRCRRRCRRQRTSSCCRADVRRFSSAFPWTSCSTRPPNMRFMFGGKATVPMTLRMPQGAGIGAAAQHSQSLESWFMNIPGLKVAIPATPYDAKGMLISAIRDDNPVVFLEHKLLYGVSGEVPDDLYTVELGKADIKREGKDVTIVATSLMVHTALEAADKLKADGIDAEVVDLRSLLPLDKETILESVKKTNSLVIAHEAVTFAGPGAEIAAIVAEESPRLPGRPHQTGRRSFLPGAFLSAPGTVLHSQCGQHH